ncbi:MAG: 16S rRNA (cytidine(1402)-2'-O)-methyltransferase [Acidimicrobiia bacterium]
MTGALVLVATPIGNLGDLSPRAVEALTSADVIAAEDTRRTRALLSHLGIAAAGRLRAVPAHDEASRAASIIELVASGSRVVVTTDAGMPAISDPGALLVRACLEAGLAVEVVPGPDAVTTALVLSGLPTDRFTFLGFLGRKGSGRRADLAAIAASPVTVVVFESPRRVRATLRDLVEACGADRRVALARELTKRHETVLRGSAAEVLSELGDDDPRGECVIVVGPSTSDAAAPTQQMVDDALGEALAGGASTRDAAATVSARLGIAKRAVYARALELNRR